MDIIKDLTSKNEKAALNAARRIIDNADIEAFKKLTEKSGFLFDFIIQNVSNRFYNVANENNYKNVIKLFKIYDENYAEAFIQILAKYADEDLTDYIYDLLENGTLEEKAYCAKYFIHIPDSIAIDLLSEYAFSDYEPLAINSAQALSSIGDDKAYNQALIMLEENDDFNILKAVKFLVSYGNSDAFPSIINAMKKSSMPENIAGELVYLVDIYELIKTNQSEDVLIMLNHLINGLGEIIPLNEIFNIRLYEIIQFLISLNKTKKSSQIAQILLNIDAKFNLLFENDEYTFDEDKNTKNELKEIKEMLQSVPEEFWQTQKDLIFYELDESNARILNALNVIKELQLSSNNDKIKNLINSSDEMILCETLATLSIFNILDNETKNIALAKMQNPHIIALADSFISK